MVHRFVSFLKSHPGVLKHLLTLRLYQCHELALSLLSLIHNMAFGLAVVP